MKKFSFNEILHKPTTGEILIDKLGLKKFKVMWLTKVLNLPINMYIIFVNARYHKNYFTYRNLTNLKTFVIGKFFPFGNDAKLIKPRFLPIRLLNKDFNERIGSNSVVIKVDVTGEMFIPQMVYEGKEVQNKLKRFQEEESDLFSCGFTIHAEEHTEDDVEYTDDPVLEHNTLKWLRKIFPSVRDEGHGSSDELIGTIWMDPNNSEQMSLLSNHYSGEDLPPDGGILDFPGLYLAGDSETYIDETGEEEETGEIEGLISVYLRFFDVPEAIVEKFNSE